MKLTRRRLTARDLMIAVAAFALSLKLGLSYSRSPDYWEESRFHAMAAASFRYFASRFDEGGTLWDRDDPAESRLTAARARQFAVEEERKQTRYQLAAFFPWLPTNPGLRSP